jgi:Uma2 family endonuclease
MAATGLLKKPATYKDLLTVPDHLVAEILDGELYASPRPALRHAHAASVLGVEIGGPFHRGRGGPGGWWILDEPELHLGKDVVVPDLAGWRQSRLPAIPDAPALTLAPDWACEVISRSTEGMDRGKKLAIYAREDVAHLWLINPVSQTLEVMALAAGRWTLLAIHVGSVVVRAEPFEVIDLDLSVLWTTTPSPVDGPAESEPL